MDLPNHPFDLGGVALAFGFSICPLAGHISAELVNLPLQGGQRCGVTLLDRFDFALVVLALAVDLSGVPGLLIGHVRVKLRRLPTVPILDFPDHFEETVVMGSARGSIR